MTIKEILSKESSPPVRIYLHREGLFWKAYEQSAFLLLQQCGKDYRVNSYLGQLQHCASRRLRLLVWVTLYLTEEPYMLMDGTMRKVGAGYRARVRQSRASSPTVDRHGSDSRALHSLG